MADLYDNIRKDAKTGRDMPLTIIVTTLIVGAVVLLVVGGWYIGYGRRFMKFVSNLSNSTTYAYENESLTAGIDGRQYRVSADNMYGIYSYITFNRTGRESSEIPEGEPVVLEYGDGSVLMLWDQPEEKTAGGHCLFLHYTDVDGKVYSYISYKTTLDTIVTRYLLYGNMELDG